SANGRRSRPDGYIMITVYDQIQTQRDGDQRLRVERICELAGVSRAGLYRYRPGPPGPGPDMALRDAIQRIALEFPRIRLATHDGRAPAGGMDRQSQARVPPDARG